MAITDPYKVLGVNRNDSEETIKKAYRELVKKYHPDKYLDSDLKDLANEKLQQVNEAYDNIVKNRKNKDYGYTYDEGSYKGSFTEVRQNIAKGDYASADNILRNSTNRNAEWHYLRGVVFQKQGWYDQAYSYFEKAHMMDPSNSEYATAYSQTRSTANAYRSNVYSRGYNSADDDFCRLCQCMLCASLCCR